MNTESRLNPSTLAFIIIDLQNDFCHQKGVAAKKAENIAEMNRIFKPISLVAERARTLCIPVIFVRTEHDDITDSEVWLNRSDWTREGGACRKGSWGADFYPIEPQDGDLVITKHRYSAFTGTPLELLLHSLGRESLLFSGVATNVCVETSLRDGLMREFHVALLADGCAARTRARHEMALENTAEYFGEVVNSETVLDIWNTF